MLDVLTPLSDCRQESVEKMERRFLGVSYLYWMDLYNGILCCGFLCAHLISVSLFRLPRRGLPRPYRYIQANRLHPSYHAPYRLLGTCELSHLRELFSYFSFHRLIRQCFHNNNFSIEPGAHRTDPLNTPASSNNSGASVWMVARPCIRPALLYRERTWAAAGGRTGKASWMRRATP